MTSYPLPIVDLDLCLRDPSSEEASLEATKVVKALIDYGAVIVKDSRVSEAANDAFLDLLEDYFAQPRELCKLDERPEYHYQVGTTLENTEKPKCHSDASCRAIIESLEISERPLDLEGGHADPKCRFFHRMGLTPPTTDFPSLAMSNVTPLAFSSTWQSNMEEWGAQIKQAVEGVTALLGVGLGVGDELTKAATYGPHLLAPTATDLGKYGKVGESKLSHRMREAGTVGNIGVSVFAGFHTDLNFLTIHGRSRYPGLHIWARNTGKRITVSLPPGHLLVQAGKQLEHLTSGLILAGYHEVVCTPATLSALANRQSNLLTSERPAIRISSTFFHHLSSDYLMRPQEFSHRIKPEWKDELGEKQRGLCEDKMVGTLVQEELQHIGLMS